MKELNEAKVLAVGPGGFDKDGKRLTPSVAPGDKVLIPQVYYPLATLLRIEVQADTSYSMEEALSRLGTRSMRYSGITSKLLYSYQS